ncbi:MAG: hypothetical protein CMJ64_18575 [Planctomycetaceae bacterium]|nr:hypothetical protein [Planctomycetaceae bacterium]
MELQWIPSATSSCYHAADGLRRGLQFANPEPNEQLLAATANLAQEIRTVGLHEDRFWSHLCAFAHQLESNLQLIRRALQKTVGPNNVSELTATALIGRIADLESAMRDALPQTDGELRHRCGPLRQHWEARGPGLLRSFADLTDPKLLPERAEIALVYPAFGGGGVAHLANNTIRVEAVLTNIVPALPEVLRIGWLLTQLNHELPIFGERVHGDRLPLLAQLATLPPILQSAAVVELSSLSADTLAAAISGWRVDVAQPADVADILLNWWDTYQGSRPPWGIALAALDQMLSP